MTLLDVLAILRARYRAFLAVFGGVLVLAVVFTLLQGREYKATASVLVDVKAPDPISGQATTASAQLAPSYMNTQVDIAESERVALKVVDNLKIAQDPSAVERWRTEGKGKGTVQKFFAALLMKKLDVKPSRESNVISINFASPDAEFAATVANAFARAFIETNVELRAEPARDYAVWFDARTQQLREKLVDAQSRLSEYERTTGIVATEERLDIETNRLADLNQQLTTVQGLSAESSSKAAQVARQTGEAPDVMSNHVIQDLRSEIARSEAKLQELGRNLGRNHPQYESASAELEGLKRKLAAEEQQVARSIGAADVVNRSREAQIRAALEEQKNKVMALKEQRDEVAVLHAEVENAQKAYDLITQRLSQTNLESQMQLTNVVLLSEATPPITPSKPTVVVNFVVGMFLGLMLALATVLGLESRFPVLRGEHDVEEFLQLPVLAVFPRPGKAQALALAHQEQASAIV